MKRSGFSMIELVFVIVILGVLAAVAVPRFVATRTDAQVATARSDLASAQKAIVAKVFADNIDTTLSSAPDPNVAVSKQSSFDKDWGDWIVEIAGLDGARWSVPKGANANLPAGKNALNKSITGKNTVQPMGNTRGSDGKAKKDGCGSVLGVQDGYMIFAPNNSAAKDASSSTGHNTFVAGDFCTQLRVSYESSGGPGNKVVPLASTGTVEF